MLNHTPGPWKAVPRSSDNDGTHDERGGLGWDIEGPPEPTLRGQFSLAADAYLTAAAPDLLDIARRVVELDDPSLFISAELAMLIDDARAILEDLDG